MDHEEQIQRIERAMERYDRNRVKLRRMKQWGKIKRNGVKTTMREPRRTAEMRAEA